MRLPAKLQTRSGFTLIFVLFAVIYIAGTSLLGLLDGADRFNGLIGAVLGAAIFAGLLWPRQGRTPKRMILLGIIIAGLMVWMSFTAIGFLSEREVAPRAAGGNSILAFLGALLMGAFIGLFTVLKQVFIPLGLGGLLGWFFRAEKPR